MLESDVRHVRTTFGPDDQLVQHVFEAPSAGALQRAGQRAGLRYERLVEAYETEIPSMAAHNDGGVT